MFGYRNAETPIVHVHVKKPKPFKWLRRLIRRIKFKHARFDNGKYSRGQNDIEKWHEDAPLVKADYPDHRWQVLNSKTRSRRGRSKHRNPKTTQNTPTKMAPRSQSTDRPISSSAPTDVQSKNAVSDFMNMDTLKHVFDNDVSGYGQCNRTESHQHGATSVDVHNRSEASSSRERCCKKNVALTHANAEGSAWSSFTKHDSIQIEVPSMMTRSQDSNHENGNCSYPSNTISPKLAGSSQDDIKANSPVISHVDDVLTNSHVPDPLDHEQDNDHNHFRVFHSRRRFSKKHRKRKNRKRRLRRKGKYVELLNESSTESLDELHVHDCPKSPSKAERVKNGRRKRIPSNPLRILAAYLQDLAGAPIFHPAKYSGYKRLCDE